MAKTLSLAEPVASVAKAAGTTTRGRWDVSALDGGVLTLAIRNGATGPTAQVFGRVLIGHKGASMPAAAAEASGATGWKQVMEIFGGVTNSATTRGYFPFGPEIAYIEVEFSTHTGNDVTVEALGTGYVY